jgi:hypothetical protein
MLASGSWEPAVVATHRATDLAVDVTTAFARAGSSIFLRCAYHSTCALPLSLPQHSCVARAIGPGPFSRSYAGVVVKPQKRPAAATTRTRLLMNASTRTWLARDGGATTKAKIWS